MLLIIVPIRNEIKTVVDTLNQMAMYLKNHKTTEVLFIDDGSTDGTFERLRSFNSSRIRTIQNKFDNGKGSAIKAGIILSEYLYKLRENDVMCFVDGDGQIDPNEIYTFLRIMNLYNADCVIGNKRHLYSSTEYSLARRVISEGYSFLIRVLFDLNIKDTQCGIKLFRKEALQSVISKVNVKRYAFDLELLTALKANRYRIADAPVTIKKQLNKGSISSWAVVHTFIDTLRIFIRKVWGYYV